MPGQISSRQQVAADAEDFFLEVARGNVPGMSAVQKFGRNLDLDNGIEEDIWAGGGTRAYLSSAETMDVASTDAADDGDPEGTGLHQVLISGLDSNYLEVEETVTLNGTSTVTTTQSFLRVNRVKGLGAGSGGINAGDISADPTTTGSGSRQGFIEAGRGQSQISHYTVPAGKTAYLVGGQVSIFAVSGSSTRSARVNMWARDGASMTWRDIKEVGLALHGSSVSSDINFTVPESFGAQSDLRFSAIADVNNTGIYVQYNLILVDD